MMIVQTVNNKVTVFYTELKQLYFFQMYVIYLLVLLLN